MNQAPDFQLPDSNGKKRTLKEFRGKYIVLYFYPKDDTPGCTLEGRDFTARIKEFESLNTVVIGISTDSPESHCNFSEKYKLGIILLSDQTKEVVKKYGVWEKQLLFLKLFYGVSRTTFLINPQGVIIHTWKKVTVNGHVEEVLEKIKELRKK